VDGTIIVGLGNPGREYEATRHNVGFLVVDELSRRWKRSWLPGKGEFHFLTEGRGESQVTLLKPMTYMNRSGAAVAEALDLFGGTADHLLVLLDDVALPLGGIRIRPGGTDGGHNGLGSVIAWVGTEKIPRCRCGVGPEEPVPGEDLSDFVLSPFSENERPEAALLIRRCADAVESYITDGMEVTMNRFNT